MPRKLQPRQVERPSLGAQLAGVGRTALMAALGAAVKTARTTPAVLADLASSGEQFLRARRSPPGPPSAVEPAELDGVFRRRLEQVLGRLAVPTQRDLERLNEELNGLRQRLEALSGSVKDSDSPRNSEEP